MVSRGHHRIVERCASPRFDFFQPLFQFVDARSEILVEVVLVVEINDADFIIGIGSSHQIQRGCVYLLTFFAHRSGVVHHDTHGNRDVVMVKRGDCLRMSVFKDVEVALVEIGDNVLLVVDYRGVKYHLFNLFLEDEDPGIARIGILLATGWLTGRTRGWRILRRTPIGLPL